MTVAGWLIVLLALICANLPFLHPRLFACVPLPYERKPIGWQLGELVFLYFIIGILSRALEARMGNVFHQGWQFYMITVSLYLVFAFPGWVCCYLIKHHSVASGNFR